MSCKQNLKKYKNILAAVSVSEGLFKCTFVKCLNRYPTAYISEFSAASG